MGAKKPEPKILCLKMGGGLLLIFLRIQLRRGIFLHQLPQALRNVQRPLLHLLCGPASTSAMQSPPFTDSVLRTRLDFQRGESRSRNPMERIAEEGEAKNSSPMFAVFPFLGYCKQAIQAEAKISSNAVASIGQPEPWRRFLAYTRTIS